MYSTDASHNCIFCKTEWHYGIRNLTLRNILKIEIIFKQIFCRLTSVTNQRDVRELPTSKSI